MSNKPTDKELRLKKARLFLNRHFKQGWNIRWKITDTEVKLLANILKPENVITKCGNCESHKIVQEKIYRCKECNCFHDKSGVTL